MPSLPASRIESEKKVSECREVFVEDVLNEMKAIIRLEGANPS